MTLAPVKAQPVSMQIQLFPGVSAVGAAAAGLPGGLGAGRARELLREAGGLHHRRPCHRQVAGGSPHHVSTEPSAASACWTLSPPASLPDAHAAGTLLQYVLA